MTGVCVCAWCVLEESATVACHCIWVFCIGRLPELMCSMPVGIQNAP